MNHSSVAMNLRNLLLLLLLLPTLRLTAQNRKVDPTWLRRSIPIAGNREDLPVPCRYRPVFGEGDPDSPTLRTVTRFGEFTLKPNASCAAEVREREEELYFVLQGNPVIHYGAQAYTTQPNDFTYLAPGMGRSMTNSSPQIARVLIMTFKIPPQVSIRAASPALRIVNLKDVKEQTVAGHPSSVLYKLLVGPGTATRDAIDQAYVVTSLFWMDFAPGGTNFPHHHEAAEEIYLLIDGQGEMVAGSGMDGVEGRYRAQAGDAYYFRPNCTVGFYNENKPEAKAHILAVRARIPPPDADD